jgi:hypothetical protein
MSVQRVLRAIAIGGLSLALLSMTAEAKTKVTSQPFGKMPDGNPVELYTLSDGMKRESPRTAGLLFP